ncbi:MAG: glycine cleavage T C-terminal barrel domain-containing protein [Acidobacteriota bacterium]
MNLSVPNSGYLALREAAAWLDVSARGKILVLGEDRARLLHAMTTNQVQELKPGQGCYALFLNAQGRILADVDILCFEDHLLLDTEPELRTKILEHLDRYIIADDVTLEDVTGQLAATALEGPRAAEFLAAFGAPAPVELWSHAQWGDSTVQRTPTGFLILGAAGLRERLAEAGVPQVSFEDARIVRLEQGRPRYGEEITDRHLVQETGLMHAVSFTKGCYLGQEIVERVRSRGQVHKQLRGIQIDTNEPPEPGAKLTSQGTDAGEIMSSAYSPALGKSVAIAYVRGPFADPGTELSLGTLPARVIFTR